MNTNTNGRRTSTSARRVVPAIAIVALAIGLAACQTPQRGDAAPEAPVRQNAEVPAGVDTWRPADRIAEQLERQVSRPTVQSSERFGGMTADRVAEQIAREKAASSEEFKGVPADRIVERLDREVAGLRIQ
jgi:hypothetical protein